MSFAPQIVLYDVLPVPINFLLGPILIGFGLIFFLLSKKFLIQPRIGTVVYSKKRKLRKKRTVLVLSINMILLFIISLLRFTGLWEELNIPEIIDILILQLLFITIPLFLVAYFIQYNRLYIIAFLMGFSLFFVELISSFIIPPFNVLFVYLLLGSIIISMGTFSLIRFLKKHPKIKEEVN